MKTFLLILSILMGGWAISVFPVNAVQATYSTGRELPGDAYSITIYKIVRVGGNAWSTSPVNAYYSPSNNCIYVTEGKRVNQPYSITENRAYGQSNDGRAEYRYVAGGYYLNL